MLVEGTRTKLKGRNGWQIHVSVILLMTGRAGVTTQLLFSLLVQMMSSPQDGSVCVLDILASFLEIWKGVETRRPSLYKVIGFHPHYITLKCIEKTFYGFCQLSLTQLFDWQQQLTREWSGASIVCTSRPQSPSPDHCADSVSKWTKCQRLYQRYFSLMSG